MTKSHPGSDGVRRSRRRWRRPWLWGLTSWLEHGGTVFAFYLALRTGPLGMTALAAFVSGILLRQVLEATSQGD